MHKYKILYASKHWKVISNSPNGCSNCPYRKEMFEVTIDTANYLVDKEDYYFLELKECLYFDC